MFSASIAAAPRLTEGPRVARLPDWEHRLTRWINRAQNERWDPGRWDCCLGMADAVKDMTGVDVGARVRGRYSTMEHAAFVVIRLHPEVGWFEGATAAELAHHGLVECKPAFARRGDVVAFDQPVVGVTWGVVDLTGKRFVAVGAKGLMWGPVGVVRRAWRVG